LAPITVKLLDIIAEPVKGNTVALAAKDAVVANDADVANELDTALSTNEAVVALLAQLAVPNNVPIKLPVKDPVLYD
jgi:hypothetical protein